MRVIDIPARRASFDVTLIVASRRVSDFFVARLSEPYPVLYGSESRSTFSRRVCDFIGSLGVSPGSEVVSDSQPGLTPKRLILPEPACHTTIIQKSKSARLFSETSAASAVPLTTGWYRLIALLIAALVTVGCGKSSEDATKPNSVAQNAASTTPAAPIDNATDRPIQVAHDGYVSSTACLDCHEDEHQSWHHSYHRTMTQVISPETILGGFDGKQQDHYGWQFTPEQRGDEFWMQFNSPSQRTNKEYKLVLSTGSHHMQKYWYHTGKSRKLGLAPLIYLREAERWVPEHTAFLRPTEPALPLREGTWNKGCNQCHATGSQPRISGPDEMDTLVAEFGISCEACHGPGEEHVKAKTSDLDSEAPMANPRKLTAMKSSQVCGQCHGAWLSPKEAIADYQQVGNKFRPGDDLFETRFYPHRKQDVELHAKMHAENSFWSDGLNRVAGRELNAMMASLCFAHDGSGEKRMSCISCHDMHNSSEVEVETWVDDQLGKTMSSNEACLQCHESYREDLAAHTHHAADSSASLCYNCHMPYTSYGLLKAVRSHTITSPSVQNSLDTGRPNACNQCHIDQTLEWTNDWLVDWYKQPKADIPKEHREIAASILWAVKGDAAQRALMAWSMGWKEAHKASNPHWLVFYLTNLMFDDYDAIRFIALRSLKRIEGFASIEYDHLKPQQERSRVMDAVMGTWMGSGKPRPTDAKLLFTSSGELRFDVFQKLFQQQDKRQIVITE